MDRLLDELKSQHEKLAEHLNEISSCIDRLDFQGSFENLTKLKEDLTKHLDLENNTFYPILLKKMREKGENVVDTENFINDMKDIEKKFSLLLSNYQNVENINQNPEGFKKDFKEISESLMHRVDSETFGVFSHWEHLDE